MSSRAEPIEKTEKKRHARLPPACQGIPVATTDRSEMTQSGHEDGRQRADKRVRTKLSQSDKAGEKFYRETMNIMAKQCEGLGRQYLADFATLPSAVVKAARAQRNRQHACVVIIEKLLTRGKKSEGLDCLVQELAKTW